MGTSAVTQSVAQKERLTKLSLWFTGAMFLGAELARVPSLIPLAVLFAAISLTALVVRQIESENGFVDGLYEILASACLRGLDNALFVTVTVVAFTVVAWGGCTILGHETAWVFVPLGCLVAYATLGFLLFVSAVKAAEVYE